RVDRFGVRRIPLFGWESRVAGLELARPDRGRKVSGPPLDFIEARPMRIVAAMTFGPHQDLLLLALLIAIAALLVLAPILRTPYPILLVLGGLALGFVPGIQTISLPPDIVLVAILPPLLYSAAFYTSLRDLRQNVIPISALAIGLVVATTVGVAAVAHTFIPHVGWGPAFVLGAVVSPTDPLAATAIARRLGVPRRIVAIVEG